MTMPAGTGLSTPNAASWVPGTVGASDYWGGTFAFERQVERGFNLYAAYTFSYTRDNQLVRV